MPSRGSENQIRSFFSFVCSHMDRRAGDSQHQMCQKHEILKIVWAMGGANTSYSHWSIWSYTNEFLTTRGLALFMSSVGRHLAVVVAWISLIFFTLRCLNRYVYVPVTSTSIHCAAHCSRGSPVAFNHEAESDLRARKIKSRAEIQVFVFVHAAPTDSILIKPAMSKRGFWILC